MNKVTELSEVGVAARESLNILSALSVRFARLLSQVRSNGTAIVQLRR
jgi:hypothetical protein